MREGVGVGFTAEMSRVLLSSFLLFVSACNGAENLIAPSPPGPHFARLEAIPAETELDTYSPFDTVQVRLLALDSKGAPIDATGPVTFSSSAPGIAEVSGTGLVTAVASGTAVITASLTLDGVTRTDSMITTVYSGRPHYRDLTGVYDLTVLITGSDPIWGIPGTRQTAVLTITGSHHGEYGSQFMGTFTDFLAISPGEAPLSGGSGTVTVSFGLAGFGGPSIDLTFAGSPSSYFHGIRELWVTGGDWDSGRITGTIYGADGHVVGTFTVVRR